MQCTYRLCDIIDDDCAVCISIVHGGERLVALLACRVPDLKLDGCVLIEGDGLGEEGGADGGFPVVVELVLDGVSLYFVLYSMVLANLDEAQY